MQRPAAGFSRPSVPAFDVWLGRLSNAAILAIAIASVWFAYDRQTRSTAGFARYGSGDVVDTTKLSLTGRSLILVSRSTCQACASSTDFYRTLNDYVLVGVASEPVEANRKFLTSSGINVADVVPLADSGLRISVVPALIAVEADGRVMRSWYGRLSRADEAEIHQLMKGVVP
jgi:hypothetical protein